MNIFKSMKYAVVLAMLLLFTICTAVFLPTVSVAYLSKTAFTDVAAGTSTFAVSFAGGMQTTDEIEVWVNGIENTSASVVWLSGSTIQLVGYTAASGDDIEFRRVSPKIDNLVDLEAGKTIRASSLMKNFRHVLQIGQEAVDSASDMLTVAEDSVNAALQAAIDAAASASIIDPERHLYRVSNIFTLRSTPATVYTAVYLDGHATANDGGQGPFIWDSTSTASDNNGTIIQVTGVITGRWIRQLSDGWVTLEMFGGKGDDSFDNTPVWANIISSIELPCIQVGIGIYRGIIDCGGKTVAIRGMAGSTSSLGDLTSVLKNNSASSRLITYNTSEYCTLRDITLDNNGVPAETVYAYRAYFLYMDEVGFINHGSNDIAMAGKYALNMQLGTLSRIGRIAFRRSYFGDAALYGGNLYAYRINYMSIAHIGGTGKLTGDTAEPLGGIGYYFDYIIGGNIGTIELVGSFKSNMMKFNNCYSMDIQNINFEVSDIVPGATIPYVYFIENRNIHIASMRFLNQFGASGNPLIGLYRNHGLSVDNFEYGRTVNDSATPIVKWFDWNYRTTFKNVYGENWDDINASNPVAHTFIDTNEAQVATESEVVVLENYRSRTAGVTHKLTNVKRVSCRNVDGTITADEGSVIENAGEMLLSSTALEIKGKNAPFQDLTMSTVNGGQLSGGSATIAVGIPANCQILGVSFRVDTTITGSTNWKAAFSGGNTTSILTGGTGTKNDKFYVPFATNLLTTSTTNIALLAADGSWTGGVIRAVVYYRKFNTLADAP